MLQQVHLQDGFLSGHGTHIELLGPDDGQFLLRLVGHEGSLLRRAGEGILTEAAGQAGLVLTNLALDGANGGVNGSEHIGSAFAGPEPGARPMDGQLHIVPVLLHRKYDQCFRILLKEPSQLHDLLLGISMDVFRQADFLLTVLKFHMRQLLSFHRSSVYLHYTPISAKRQGVFPCRFVNNF